MLVTDYDVEEGNISDNSDNEPMQVSIAYNGEQTVTMPSQVPATVNESGMNSMILNFAQELNQKGNKDIQEEPIDPFAWPDAPDQA